MKRLNNLFARWKREIIHA